MSDNALLARKTRERGELADAMQQHEMGFTSSTFHAPGEPGGRWTSHEYLERERVERVERAIATPFLSRCRLSP